MKFDLNGQTYEFNDSRITFAEFRYVKRELGLTSSDFLGGLIRLDVEALAGAVLLTMRRRAVADPALPAFTAADLDEVDMLALITSVAEHAKADTETEPEVVETEREEPVAAKTRKRAA